METGPAEELSAELYARCEPIVELDAAQIEGFVSGLFAVWDTVAEAEHFLAWCERHPGPRSATVCAGIAAIDTGPIGRRARRVFDTMADSAPEAVALLGRWSPGQAWHVAAPFGESIVIGYIGADGDTHSVLAELDEDDLADLQLAGPPAELFDAMDPDRQVVTVDPLEVATAVGLVRAAWNSSHGRVLPTPGMLANQWVVRRRLHLPNEPELPLFSGDDAEPDLTRGMTAAEIDDANRAARSTLLAAVGEPGSTAGPHPAWVDVVHGSAPGLSPREREALLWLEWADWLGAGIGLVRSPELGPLDGEAMVDLVNRCPEVSSTVHADDRDYAAWAFDVALDHLRDAGLVVDNELTSEGHASLHPSLIAAWGGD